MKKKKHPLDFIKSDFTFKKGGSIPCHKCTKSHQEGGSNIITTPLGQWAYPGQVTRIPSNNITMQGVNYPVLGIDNTGYKQMMLPGGQYSFPGTSVTEYPIMRNKSVSPIVKDKPMAQEGITVQGSSPLDVPQGYFLNPGQYRVHPKVYYPTYTPGQNAAKGTAEQDYTLESIFMPMPPVGKTLGRIAKVGEKSAPVMAKAEKLLKTAQKEEGLNAQALSKLKKGYDEGMHRVNVYKHARNKFQDDLLKARYTGKNIKDYGWSDQDIELLSGRDRSTGAFRNNLYQDDNAATKILSYNGSIYYDPMHYKGVTPHDPTGHSIFDFPQAPKDVYTVLGYTVKKPSTLKKILTFGLPDDSDRLYQAASKYDKERSAAAKLYNLEKAKEFSTLYNQPYKVTEFPILNKQGGAVTWSIIGDKPKAQNGATLPINPLTGLPVVNLPEVRITPDYNEDLKTLGKAVASKSDAITQLGFTDPVTLATLAAATPVATIPAAVSYITDLGKVVVPALNAPIAGIPGATLNNLASSAAYTGSMFNVLNPNSPLHKYTKQAITDPNMENVPAAINEGLWTGLGFVGAPSPVSNTVKGLLNQVKQKAPIYLNPDFTRNWIGNQYPFTPKYLDILAESKNPIIEHTIVGTGLGTVSGILGAYSYRIPEKQRLKYNSLIRKQREGQPLTIQEKAFMDKHIIEFNNYQKSSAKSILGSIATGSLLGTLSGIGYRNKNALRNFLRVSPAKWAENEAYNLASLDPQRHLELMEARNNWWAPEPNIINLRQQNLLRFYGTGNPNDYRTALPNPPSVIDIDPSIFTPRMGTIPLQREDRLFGMTRDEIDALYNSDSWRNYQPLYNSDSWRNYQPLDWSQFNQSSSPTVPSTVNRSRLTKAQAKLKVSDENLKKIDDLTEEEFANTVITPKGDFENYHSFNPQQYFTGKNEIVPSTVTEWATEFNSRVDRLNSIIKKNNKSGVDYEVVSITPTAGSNYAYIKFRTPAQTLSDGTHIPGGTNTWSVQIDPGFWRGEVENINNIDYFTTIPGLQMKGTGSSAFYDANPRKNSRAYESINEFLKELDLGRVKPGFNGQSDKARGVWSNFINNNKAVGYWGDTYMVHGVMKKKGGSTTWQIID